MPQDIIPQNSDELMYAFDVPAYVRRARGVEDAWNVLLDNCRHARGRLLEMPRMRLAKLFVLGQLAVQDLPDIIADEDLRWLRALHQDWQPQLRAMIKPARSESELERAKTELQLSFRRFNMRWSKHLHELELAPINRLRDNYNRYYLLEKECAVRSARVAQAGFVPLKCVSVADLFEEFPLLRIPS